MLLLGQIEGGLMMGLGWIKSEDRTWGQKGSNESGTWNYKSPMHLDIPKNFSLQLTNVAPEFDKQPNHNYPGWWSILSSFNVLAVGVAAVRQYGLKIFRFYYLIHVTAVFEIKVHEKNCLRPKNFSRRAVFINHHIFK